jgi:N-methylhydantoinase B
VKKNTHGEFDPISLEILWNRLESIADEAATALRRTSFSTIVREANDYACVLLDQNCNFLAGNTIGIPSFSLILSRTVRHFLRKFPPREWRPGDAVLTNDPWLACGHLNDIALAVPIFYKGHLVGFYGSVAHSADVGGSLWAADNREVFEEGIRFPPSWLMKAGEPNEEVVKIIEANVRVPRQVLGDLYAQAGAGEVCAQRVQEFMEEQQMVDLSPLGDAIRARAEESMRRAIDDLPDGEYSDTIEADGFDEPTRIQVKITIKGSDLEVDYTGTSPQVNRGLNSPWNYTYAYTVFPIKCALDPFTLHNEGAYRPMKVEVPLGSILNPRFPAPVGARQLTTCFAQTVLYRALAQAIPNRVLADCGSSPTFRTVYAGTDPEGEPFSTVLFANGGLGARPDRDGLSCSVFPGNSGCGSIEVMEGTAPLLFWKKEMIQDSGGPGKYRGGLAQEIEVQVLSEQPITLSVLSDRRAHPALGLFGGMPGSLTDLTVNRKESVHPKARRQVNPGDILTLRYAGGGGYGPPEERELERVLDDLRNGLISEELARQAYRIDTKQASC